MILRMGPGIATAAVAAFALVAYAFVVNERSPATQPAAAAAAPATAAVTTHVRPLAEAFSGVDDGNAAGHACIYGDPEALGSMPILVVCAAGPDPQTGLIEMTRGWHRLDECPAEVRFGTSHHRFMVVPSGGVDWMHVLPGTRLEITNLP